ncbi:MAG: CoA transferase [Acidimicrobiales bacterium]
MNSPFDGGQSLALLSGVRVLEAAEYVTGPMAGLVLADLGADVVKVERPEKGDAMRTYGVAHRGVSAFWLNVNRGKRSICLDLKEPGGRACFLDLIEAADVVIRNWRPGSAERLDLADPVLAGRNPRCIRVELSGFGSTGPRSDEPVFDSVVQANCGLVAAQSALGEPNAMATLVADKVTAMVAAQVVLAALFERSQTGAGRRIELSMLDATAYWSFPDVFQAETFLDDPSRTAPSLSPVVATTDGYVVVVPVSGAQAGRLAQALGHPEWKEELKAIKEPGELGRRLNKLVASVTCSMSSEEVISCLRSADVPVSKVLAQADHLVDPQVIHNRTYCVRRHESTGPVRVVRFPAIVDGIIGSPAFSVPDVGEHDEAVLREWQKTKPATN